MSALLIAVGLIALAACAYRCGYKDGQRREQVRFVGGSNTEQLITEGRRRYVAIHGPLAPTLKDEREYLRYVNRNA